MLKPWTGWIKRASIFFSQLWTLAVWGEDATTGSVEILPEMAASVHVPTQQRGSGWALVSTSPCKDTDAIVESRPHERI